ncbi:MAG: tetratricopeptide repeat protein, partial [Kofleriaceae bacterium]|nr:tetratricopeptide repeat protein [Kofleriaceae bacterium]
MFASRKKWHACLLPSAVALTVAVAPLTVPHAFAQNSALSEARSHYNKGSELFAQGDYQAAIGEFATADKLSHSPLLQYNIALCYDRLGSHSEALRRYRRYLKEAPNSSNRSAVEGKINRVEGVLRSVAEEKRASDEQRKAEERAAAA